MITLGITMAIIGALMWAGPGWWWPVAMVVVLSSIAADDWGKP